VKISFRDEKIRAGQKLRRGGLSFVTLLAFGFFMGAFTTTTAWAQGDASIRGTLSDATGSAIAGGTIKVKNLETGLARALVTDGPVVMKRQRCPWALTRYRRRSPDFNPRNPK
jgi:hypothetical protein